MNHPPRSTKKPTQEWLDVVKSNQGKVGNFFTRLLHEYYDTEIKPTIGYFVRLRAYRNNDIPKLIELAQDFKTANEGTIKFINKYSDELFAPEAAKLEKEQVKFLNKIIAYLNQKK